MKKIIPILFILFLVYGLTNKEEVIIPDYAIRFRVIANSNTIQDQTTKYLVKNDLENKLNDLMQNVKTKEEASEKIEESMPWIREEVNKYTLKNTVSYGKNEFPEKEYKGVVYPSGKYDSLVITLGSGQGENWWCVMFPPLCLLDAKEKNPEDVEYKFFVQEILNQWNS